MQHRLLSRFLAVVIASGVAALAYTATATETTKPASQADAQAIIASWPDTAKKAATAMLDQYGKPDGVTESMLIWEKNGPWLRTVVYREEIPHNFPMPHQDVLEQFIAYQVPVDKFDELAAFDGSVIVERTKGVISARCDKEGANFLALNLANDIIEGKRSVEDARQVYADTVKAFMQGEKPKYMQRLLFEPPAQKAAADPDEKLLQQVKAPSPPKQ